MRQIQIGWTRHSLNLQPSHFPGLAFARAGKLTLELEPPLLVRVDLYEN